MVGQYASLGTIYASVNPRIGQIWQLNGEDYVVVGYEWVEYVTEDDRDNQQVFKTRVRRREEIDLFFERYGNQEPMEVRPYDWTAFFHTAHIDLYYSLLGD
jgi:hypothetical protein